MTARLSPTVLSVDALWSRASILLLVLVLAACGSTHIATPSATATATPSPSPTELPITLRSSTDATPAYATFLPLLAQVAAVGPVYVTADQTVPSAALSAAGDTLSAMLQHRPNISAQLRASGAFTVVASRSEAICDLPYFRQYQGQANTCGLYGEGGAGGIAGHPITACDERNLLDESDDPYQRGASPTGQNICVHELAHTIMNVGLSPTDVSRIKERCQAAKGEGLWSGDYAMTNEMEFWAVMSQFYFHAGPSAPYSSFQHIANGPTALDQYDPATFAVLDSIYQGSTNLQ